MANASPRVFVERHDSLDEVPGIVLDERNLKTAVKNIARAHGGTFPKTVRCLTRARQMARA